MLIVMCHSQAVKHRWHSGLIGHGLIGYSGAKVFDRGMVVFSPQKAGVCYDMAVYAPVVAWFDRVR